MTITEDEFLRLLSSVVRSGNSNALIKDSEKRLTTVCTSQPAEVFVWCVKHLHIEGAYYPEHILMAQSLLRMCRTNERNESSRSALLELLANFNARMVPVTNPVVTQVCSSLATSMVLEESVDVGHGWLGSVCCVMIQAGPGPTDQQSSWFCYITAVLGLVAEVCAHPELQRTYSHRICARGRVSSKCRGRHALVEAVLFETSNIIHFVSQVGVDTPNELRLQCLWCCTKWLELASTMLQDKQATEDQNCIPASLNSLALWVGSGIGARALNWAARCLRSHPAMLQARSVFGDIYSASLELVEVMCRCANPETAGPQALKTTAVLDSIAGQMSTALLPTLRTFLRSVTCAVGSSGHAGDSLSAAGGAAVRAIGMIGSCAADMLARADPGRNVPHEGAQGSACGASQWLEFLADLVCDVGELSVALGQGHGGWLVVEGLQPLLGVLCERALREETGDDSAVAAVLERIALLAVGSTQYPSSTAAALDLQCQEDFEAFRSTVRDWLREIATPVPRVVSSILANAVGSLRSYIDSVSTAGRTSGAVPWPAAEAWLHALSAVSKHVVRSLAEERTLAVSSDAVKSEVRQLLVALSRTECVACRPLSRMGVVLIAEFLPRILRETDQSANDLELGSVGALLLSLLHVEAPTAGPLRTADVHFGTTVDAGCGQLCHQATWLPFRVKQDHIGAVSLLKVVAGRYVGLGSGPTSLQLPAICSLLCSDLDFSGRVSTVVRALWGEGVGVLNAALLSMAFTLLMEPLGRRGSITLSSKSGGLVREAAVVSLFTSGKQNLAAFVVPVSVSVVALLNPDFTEQRVSDVAKSVCDLMFIPEEARDATRSAVMSVSALLISSCTIEQLLDVVSETFAALRRMSELRLPHEADEYAGLLKIGLLVLASCSFQPGLPPALVDALSRLFCECAQLPRVCPGVQQHATVVFAPIFADLSAVLPIAQGRRDPQLFRVMILPAASQLVRSIGDMTDAGASAQFTELFCHLIHSVSSAAVTDVSGKSADSLVIFLSDSVAATALVPCLLGRQRVQLPVDTLLVACTAVCTRTSAALERQDESFPWKAAFKAIASMLGPLNVQCEPVPLDLDGYIPAAMLSVSALHASHAGYGSPELIALMTESQAASAMTGILVRCLVGSAPLKGESGGWLPSSLREICVATMIKIVLCIGTDRSGGLLLSATWDNGRQRPICASLVDPQQWVRRLLQCAEHGDWKKFKANLRVLVR